MVLVELSGKQINVEGLEMSEKEFYNFFSKLKPWKEMHEPSRTEALKADYKVYKKSKPKASKE